MHTQQGAEACDLLADLLTGTYTMPAISGDNLLLLSSPALKLTAAVNHIVTPCSAALSHELLVCPCSHATCLSQSLCICSVFSAHEELLHTADVCICQAADLSSDTARNSRMHTPARTFGVACILSVAVAIDMVSL